MAMAKGEEISADTAGEQEYRTVGGDPPRSYANHVEIEVGKFDVLMRLGVIEDVTTAMMTVRNGVAVYMTHHLARALMDMLVRNSASLER